MIFGQKDIEYNIEIMPIIFINHSIMLETFFSWVILGILIAAPVGPIWILCMKNTLQYWKTSWFFTWLWASFADATYGVIAVIWLWIMSQFLLEYKIIIQMLWILFLLYVSIQILKSKQNSQEL